MCDDRKSVSEDEKHELNKNIYYWTRAVAIAAIASCLIYLVTWLTSVYGFFETKKQNSISQLESINISDFFVALSPDLYINKIYNGNKEIGSTQVFDVSGFVIWAYRSVGINLPSDVYREVEITNDGNINFRKVEIDFFIDNNIIELINSMPLMKDNKIILSHEEKLNDYHGIVFKKRFAKIYRGDGNTIETVDVPSSKAIFHKGDMFRVMIPSDVTLIINLIYLNFITSGVNVTDRIFRIIFTGINELNENVKFVFDVYFPFFLKEDFFYIDSKNSNIRVYPVQSEKNDGISTSLHSP